MENNEEYERLINGLSQKNFDGLVLEYAKEYYQTDELHISNGPYDGGQDLVYFKNGKEVKRSIQVTIEKNKIKAKIFDDIEKAQKNHLEKGYHASLDFYISTSISQSKKKEYVHVADVDYGINLKIIDGRKLSYDIDRFPSIKTSLKSIYGVLKEDKIFTLSKREKILYNVISSGEDSSKIKRHLVHAFILTILFEKGGLNYKEILQEIKEKYSKAFVLKGVKDEVNYLKSKGFVSGGKRFDLTDKSIEKLEEILDLNEYQEGLITEQISALLKEHGVFGVAKKVARELVKLYINHFTYDLEEFRNTDNSFVKSMRSIQDKLKSHLINNGIEDERIAADLAIKIIEASSKNEFLTKIGASSMYVKLFNSNKLERYLKKSKRSIGMDTQILIRLLCVLENKNVEDYSLRVVRQFYDEVVNSDLQLDLFTTFEYVMEVSGHLQKALKICNFIELPIFKGISKTRNIFYNFYEETHRKDIGSCDFRTFMEKNVLGIKLPDEFNREFSYKAAKRISDLFEHLNIDVVETPRFGNELSRKVKKGFELKLKQRRSKAAIIYDVKAALFLSDENNHFDAEEEIQIEPYFVTWDYQYFGLRSAAKKSLKNYSNWFVYTPQKFLEKLLLSRFKFKPESINETILSMVESEFNSGESKKQFFDVISILFSSENVGELKVAQKFADLQREFEEGGKTEDEFRTFERVESPLTYILGVLVDHYNNPEKPHSLELLSAMFEDEKYFERIMEQIDVAIESLKNGKMKLSQLKKRFNALLKDYQESRIEIIAD